jgi:hypothetical protein
MQTGEGRIEMELEKNSKQEESQFIILIKNLICEACITHRKEQRFHRKT